ncbi:hypothetical protein GWK47_020348 [Chionoecetes opilio]|uniref:Uncharacterized protein n=1 Tax=Chionoecetes opilio TaxID=41210 RepID=A0A8J5BWC6_CHIOP|nr:hypothetical protein GWK47_020348 [Chionoecetes opilio]
MRHLRINELCAKENRLLPSGNVDMASLPTCKRSLTQHIRRVNHQVGIWKRAHVPRPRIPKASQGHGWEEENGHMDPVWYEGDLLPRQLADIAQVAPDDADSGDDSSDSTCDEMEPAWESDGDDSDDDETVYLRVQSWVWPCCTQQKPIIQVPLPPTDLQCCAHSLLPPVIFLLILKKNPSTWSTAATRRASATPLGVVEGVVGAIGRQSKCGTNHRAAENRRHKIVCMARGMVVNSHLGLAITQAIGKMQQALSSAAAAVMTMEQLEWTGKIFAHGRPW